MFSDFTYDGTTLSSLGYMVCWWDKETNTAAKDAQRNFNQISMYLGRYQPFTVTSYDNTLEMTFGICKMPCGDQNYDIDTETGNPILTENDRHLLREFWSYDGNDVKGEDGEISIAEMRYLKRWLSAPNPRVFSVNDERYEGIKWEGSFNIEEVNVGSKRVGLNLTFTSNRPFGIEEDRIIEGDIKKNGAINVSYFSDEWGYTYPYVKIECRADGDLTIYNAYDQRSTMIKNCVDGEIITIDKQLQIASSITTHDVFSDFNYVFLRLGRDKGSSINKLTFTLPCHYTISYTPVAKVVAV